MFQPTQQKLVDLSHFQEGPGGILSRGSDILLHLSTGTPIRSLASEGSDGLPPPGTVG